MKSGTLMQVSKSKFFLIWFCLFHVYSNALADPMRSSSSPTMAEFERYLEKAHMDDIRLSYEVVKELDFVDATKEDCAAQRYFLNEALKANPFGLALARVAWHCAKFSGDATAAQELALRFDAVYAMYVSKYDGKFLSSAIPVSNFWDIIAVADSKGAAITRGEFLSIMNLGDLRYSAWLKYPDQRYELVYFNLSDNLVRAGRSLELYSTPAARFFLIASLLDSLAEEGVVEAEAFQLKQNATTAAEALAQLRARYTQDARIATTALPLLVASMEKCGEADVKVLAKDAESLEPAALINFALERTLGLCSAPDPAHASKLLSQAQSVTKDSVTALLAEGLLTVNSLDKLSAPMLTQLKRDAVTDPRAALMVFMLTNSQKDLEVLSQRHMSVSFVFALLKLTAAQTAKNPELQKRDFCIAAKSGNPFAMRKCASLLRVDSERNDRIELEKAGLFSMPSDGSKDYFAANSRLVGELIELKRLDEALNWAVSAIVLGDRVDFKVGAIAAMGGKLNTIIDEETLLSSFMSDEKAVDILKRQIALGAATNYASALKHERKSCLRGSTNSCHAIVLKMALALRANNP
jgi:hypothetical protein